MKKFNLPGRQKCLENDFWQKLVDDSAYTLGVKNVGEITLSHTVYKINAFLGFRRNSRWLPKIGGKQFFDKGAR